MNQIFVICHQKSNTTLVCFYSLFYMNMINKTPFLFLYVSSVLIIWMQQECYILHSTSFIGWQWSKFLLGKDRGFIGPDHLCSPQLSANRQKYYLKAIFSCTTKYLHRNRRFWKSRRCNVDPIIYVLPKKLRYIMLLLLYVMIGK